MTVIVGELNLERWCLRNSYNHSILIASIRHEVSYNSLQQKELEQQTHNGEPLNGTIGLKVHIKRELRILRKPHRERRSAVFYNYIMYLQEHVFDNGIEIDPIMFYKPWKVRLLFNGLMP